MKKFLSIISIISIISLSSFSVYAADWERYNTGSYIDNASIIQIKDGSYNFRYRILKGQKRIAEEEIVPQAAYAILNANIDCQKGIMFNKSISMYDENHQFLYGKEYKPAEISKISILPYSDEKILSDYVCTYFMKKVLKTKIQKETKITNEDVDLSGYMAELQRSVKSSWNPVEIKENEQVVIMFSVNREGNLTGEIKIVQSSGNRVLDESAIQAIKDAEPFYPLPKRYIGSKIDVEFTFDYKTLEKKKKKKKSN